MDWKEAKKQMMAKWSLWQRIKYHVSLFIEIAWYKISGKRR